MASAVIRGCPDAPDSPLQGGAGWELAGGSEPVAAGACGPCAKAIPQVAATSPAAMTIGRALCIPLPVSPIIPNLCVTRYHFSGVNGLILFSTHLDPGENPCFLGLNTFTIRIARKVPYDAYPQSHFSGGRAWDP